MGAAPRHARIQVRLGWEAYSDKVSYLKQSFMAGWEGFNRSCMAAPKF